VLAWTLPHDVTELDLPADARASHHARTAVRSVADGLSCIDDVLLATSELTANALQHGGGSPHLTTVRTPDSIVVALTDRRPDVWPLVLPMRGTVAASGRGMAIVQAISATWGVTAYHDRKVVWCELFGN
jgi:anti-sigma regulatory factor (Ser/Thr protein kinase)